jgi:hypothetical protein
VLLHFAGEELRVNYIFKVGGIVRYDVKDSFDNIPATKNSEEAHDPSR